jgi:hypothetical protein
MSPRQLLDLATELRARAASADPCEKEDLLFLASEYDAMANRLSSSDQEATGSIIIPK